MVFRRCDTYRETAKAVAIDTRHRINGKPSTRAYGKMAVSSPASAERSARVVDGDAKAQPAARPWLCWPEPKEFFAGRRCDLHLPLNEDTQHRDADDLARDDALLVNPAAGLIAKMR
jgi:hypothetical protein